MKKVIILIFLSYNLLNGQELALLKYNGGGDWYANPTSLPNLIKFCNQNLSTKLKPKHAVVEANSIELFSYPFVHLTGHGNIVFTSQEITNLRRTFMLYAKLPKSFYSDIEKCEKDYENNKELYKKLLDLRWKYDNTYIQPKIN
jgi:hypothetical protein